MAQITVLHLMNHFTTPGIGCYVSAWLQHMDKRVFSWHVGALSGRGDQKEEFRRLGVQVVDFSDKQNGSRIPIKRIREYIIAHHIDIVHAHNPRASLAAAVALAGLHQTIHLSTEHHLLAPGERRWGLIYTLVGRFSLYLPDHIVAVSPQMRDQIVALPGLSANRVTAIRNAIDCEAFYSPDQRDPCRSEFGLAPESQVIGFTGPIVKVKRLDLLLNAFSIVLAHYPQTRLMIIGVGWLRPKLEALEANLGISHAVIWTGFRQDIPRLLAAMDIYVQPSANEGLSRSILEAMSAGKPVIVTDVGGAKEMVSDGRTGILIPPGSASAIATAIVDLFDHPEKRSALAQAGRSHVVQEFGVQRLVDEYQDLYQSLTLKV